MEKESWIDDRGDKLIKIRNTTCMVVLPHSSRGFGFKSDKQTAEHNNGLRLIYLIEEGN